jgi:hypothetical protein
MLTYLVRPRGLYREPEGADIIFPAKVEVTFRLEPGGPFGENVPPLRTVPLGAKVRIHWNVYRGETSIETETRFPPLELRWEGQDGQIVVNGSNVVLTTEVESRAQLEGLLETYYYVLPALLGLEMQDAPVVAEVRGRAGSVAFCWGLIDSGCEAMDVTTIEVQKGRFQRALHRLNILDERNGPTNRRLLAAIQYLHIACRLARAPGRRWEFLSESLLNFAKILEVLFPAPPQKTIETTRSELRTLGFAEAEIEAFYIPALALRNALDVAHPTLAAHSAQQLLVLQTYTELAEDAFKALILRIFDHLQAGTFALQSPQSTEPSPETVRMLKRLDRNLRKYRAMTAPAGDRALSPTGDDAV